MADAGWILPVYHGNEAETDLKPVGDVDVMPILRGLYSIQANCTRANAANATMNQLSICNKTTN